MEVMTRSWPLLLAILTVHLVGRANASNCPVNKRDYALTDKTEKCLRIEYRVIDSEVSCSKKNMLLK